MGANCSSDTRQFPHDQTPRFKTPPLPVFFSLARGMHHTYERFPVPERQCVSRTWMTHGEDVFLWKEEGNIKCMNSISLTCRGKMRSLTTFLSIPLCMSCHTKDDSKYFSFTKYLAEKKIFTNFSSMRQGTIHSIESRKSFPCDIPSFIKIQTTELCLAVLLKTVTQKNCTEFIHSDF